MAMMLALLEDVANGRIRRERVFRDHNDFLAHNAVSDFPRAILLELLAELGPNVESEQACRHNPFPYVLSKGLIAQLQCQLYGTGSSTCLPGI